MVSLPDMWLINDRDKNVQRALLKWRAFVCLWGGICMLKTQFYFLSDQHYLDFPDDKLMKNKDMIDGLSYKHPCFLAFSDFKNSDIYWAVQIASKCEKYKRIEQDKIKKYGRFNTICFGILFGREKVF